MSPVCVVSLLTWDAPDYVENLLRNLDAMPPGGNWHLRITDQGSGERTRMAIDGFARTHSNVSVDFLDHNIGYPAGHNRAYHAVRNMGHFDYFCTINPDVVFCDPGWLDGLVHHMQSNPDLALCGPLAFRFAGNNQRWATPDEISSGTFDFIAGVITIIRCRAADQHGLFDPAFTPGYWEDADMCWRYRHGGWRIGVRDIRFADGYLGRDLSSVRSKQDQLFARFGHFERRNRALFDNRWQIGLPIVAADPHRVVVADRSINLPAPTLFQDRAWGALTQGMAAGTPTVKVTGAVWNVDSGPTLTPCVVLILDAQGH